MGLACGTCELQLKLEIRPGQSLQVHLHGCAHHAAGGKHAAPLAGKECEQQRLQIWPGLGSLLHSIPGLLSNFGMGGGGGDVGRSWKNMNGEGVQRLILILGWKVINISCLPLENGG